MADEHSKFSGPASSPKPPATVDVAEMIALRSIVMGLVAITAAESERVTGEPAQMWINSFAEGCAKAISGSITSQGEDFENLKQRTLDYLNVILGGIKFPKIQGGN